MSVIFLAGVHGVGKGFLGTRVAKAVGVIHFTASQLIREEKGLATWGTDRKTSALDDNQVALIRAVSQKRLIHPKILLDGHFVLRNELGILTPLEKMVFRELHLTGVILLTEESNIIACRLAMRDGGATDVFAISELAEAESAHVQDVCHELGLPLTVINSPTEESLSVAIERLTATV
ncbi:MAG TPA: ATP-binding protein [Polaromonas sp.]|uniref:ATP-binding protein n=1 Tax=Polaromonas sp. TaxID=1869339 RepID=UPI002D30D6B8|nr:ATP-binding protein [Polaromonas sp.]HYW58108.1 ATP-binding protein [Polaromonas sp.]